MLWGIETIFLSIIYHKYDLQNQQKYFDNLKKQSSFLSFKIYLTLGNISIFLTNFLLLEVSAQAIVLYLNQKLFLNIVAYSIGFISWLKVFL